MANEPDQITEAITRALDAAEAANSAAEDMARISAAHRTFAEGVARGQRRSAALAGGAVLGAVLGLALGGLVWFRSVADLRQAGEVQATAAELLVEQVTRFDALLDKAEERDAAVKTTLDAMTDQVSHDLAKLARSQEPLGASVTEGLREGVKAEVSAAKDEVLAALAKRPAETGSVMDTPEMKALLAEMQTLSQGIAADRAAAAPAAASAPEPARAPKPKPAAKPAGRAAKPAEPDPFVYP